MDRWMLTLTAIVGVAGCGSRRAVTAVDCASIGFETCGDMQAPRCMFLM